MRTTERGSRRSQPTGGEVGQRLVDRLAGGADQLGELLLGEVVVDVDAVLGGAAEAVGEVEQRLGDTARDVGEDQVGDHVVGPAQAGGELGQQAVGHVGAAVEPAQQVVVRQGVERHVGHRGHRRRARTRVEQRQLAEHLAGAEDRQQVLAAVAGGAAQLHLALGDDVELVAGVPLVEEHLAATQPDRAERAAQRSGRLVVERVEQRCLTQDVRVHGASSKTVVQVTS